MSIRQTRQAGALIMTGMFLIILTRYLRSNAGTLPPLIVFLLGILPNFGAALSLPFAVFTFPGPLLHLQPAPRFAIALGITFLGLTAWEVSQLLIWQLAFDPNDILATGAGLFCAVLGYRVIWRN